MNRNTFGTLGVDGDDGYPYIEAIAAKGSPNHEELWRKEIDETFNQVTLIEISIDHMSGKEAIITFSAIVTQSVKEAIASNGLFIR